MLDKQTLQYMTEECIVTGIEKNLIIIGRNKKSIGYY